MIIYKLIITVKTNDIGSIIDKIEELAGIEVTEVKFISYEKDEEESVKPEEDLS